MSLGFTGFRTSTIDAKGRIKLPSDHHKQFIEFGFDKKFILTRHQDEPCLVLYPLDSWQNIERKVSKLPTTGSHAKLVRLRVLGYATQCELDNQGRILVPGSLREIVPLEKKVCLSGQSSGIQIWSEQALEGLEERLVLSSQNEEIPKQISEIVL